MLGDAGLTVTEASNGISALRLALELAPHIVVVGPELPEMSAAELADGLRSDPRTRHTAIVGVHSVVDADASLEMPCNPFDLLGTVVRALEGRRQKLAAEAPTWSVIASARGTWPLGDGVASRSSSSTRNAGRSGKWRLSNGIETL
jgi:CheY-like chemotaxis protein